MWVTPSRWLQRICEVMPSCTRSRAASAALSISGELANKPQQHLQPLATSADFAPGCRVNSARRLRRIYEEMDADHDGRINSTDLKTYLEESSRNLAKMATGIFNSYDRAGKGFMSFRVSRRAGQDTWSESRGFLWAIGTLWRHVCVGRRELLR